MIPAFGPPWIRAARSDARLRLFCLPRAGGGVADYHAWADHLPDTLDVCPIALPGRESRRGEPPYDELPALVGDLARGLAPLLRTPFALFGHSMGAWIAFELARQLRRAGLPQPVHLLVSARQAPHLGLSRPPLHHLPEPAFVAEIQRRFGGIPDKLLAQPAILRMFLPALRADFTLLDRYAYTEEPPLDLPLTAFAGTDDAVVQVQAVEAWQAHTVGPFALRPIPGAHFYHRDQAEALCGHIAEVLQPHLP